MDSSADSEWGLTHKPVRIQSEAMSQEPQALPPPPPRTGEPPDSRILRFGVFALDTGSGELRKSGVLVKLRQQPATVLALLASHPGRVVTREELRAQVWGGDTFVDFDQGLNYCIKEIRAALSDSADSPLYVETLPRRGYRFIAPLAGSGEAAPHADSGAHPRPTGLLVPSLLLVLVAAVGATAYLARRSAPPEEWQRITFRRGSVSAARFGPGGEIVMSAAWDGGPASFWSAAPGSPDARPLDVAGSQLVSVTANGEIVFLLAQPGSNPLLERAPRAGGPAKAILESVVAADATANGADFAVAHFVAGRGIRIEYPIGRELRQVNAPRCLRISPDGSHVAFLEHPWSGDDRGFVAILPREGTAAVYSSHFASLDGLAWSAAGDAVLFTAARTGSNTALLSLDLRGRERTLLPPSGRLVVHDVAPDGRLLLERAAIRGGATLVAEDGSERDLSWFDATRIAALSPDGSLALLSETGDAGGAGYAAYLRRTDGSAPVRLGTGVATGLSPDGRVALAIPLEEPTHIDAMPTGAGETRQIRFAGIVQYEWASFTPDGARLVFVGRTPDQNLRVWVGDKDGGTARPITPDGLTLSRDLVSPDSRSLVGPCRPRIFCLYSLAEGGDAPHAVPGLEGFLPLAWDPGGRSLLVRRRTGGLPAVLERVDLASGVHTPWRTLSPRDPVGVGDIGYVAVSRDGRSLVYSFSRRLSELYLVSPLKTQ
jgi:eukaryotic-like serine/threonine-protein kinase